MFSQLKSKIDQLWNKFWSGGISNPLTAIEQITYLLFMKRMDDLDLKKVADAEFTGEKYLSKFEGYWVAPEHIFKLDEIFYFMTHSEKGKVNNTSPQSFYYCFLIC